MVGWHHRLDGHESEQAPGVGDGQGGLACCRPWGRRESDTTELLNWYTGFPGGSVVENLPGNAADLGLIPELGRPPGGGHGNPLQCSCLEHPTDRGAW